MQRMSKIMSSFEEVEEESEEEEDEAEDTYEESPVMPGTKRQSRQSTIVQVNTGALEIHLRQMKKQLLRHEAELAHPSWMDELMEQVNKIPVIERKVEHCQLDMNSIRQTLLPTSGDSSVSGDSSLPSIEYLRSELEGVRMIVRRIDAHQSVEAMMFSKVRELQMSMKEALKSKGPSSERIKRDMDALVSEIKKINMKLEDVDNQSASAQQLAAFKQSEMEKKTKTSLEELAATLDNKLDELRSAVVNDMGPTLTHTQDAVELSSKKADRAVLLAIRGPISQAVLMLASIARFRQELCLRRRFDHWKLFDPFGVKSKGRRFLRLTDSAARKADKRTTFVQWKQKCNRLQNVERIKSYLKNIISRWSRQSLPSCRDSFLQWKRFTLSFKVSELPRTCIPPSQQQELHMDVAFEEAFAGSVATGKLPMSRDPAMQKCSRIVTYRSLVYDKLVASLDPHKDMNGCLSLVGRYLDDVSRDVAYGYHLTDEVDFRVTQTNKLMDKLKADIHHKYDAKVDGLESALNYQRTSSLSVLNEFKREHRITQDQNDKKLKEHSEYLSRFEKRIGDIAKGMEEQNEKIERLFTLHGSMLSRIDTIERVQEETVKNVQVLLSDMTTAKTCIARTSDDLAIQQQQNDRVISSIDADITALQEQSRQAETYMNNVLSQQMHSNKQTVSEIQEFHKKISGFESWLRETAPKCPTPKDIASLCFQFEAQAIEKHSLGQQSLRFAFTADIVKPLTKHAQCLAEHIVRSTDIDILVSVVHGPKSSLLKTIDPLSEGSHRNETEALLAMHEEVCASSRERYVARFMDAFFNALDADQRPPGVVRDEARLIFIRKFLNCIDLALSKLDTIVLGASTSFGRNNSNPNSSSQAASCIACDRPLRVRIAATEPGKLEERLAKLQHKITEATLRCGNNNSDSSAGHVSTIVVARPGSASPALATLTETRHEEDDGQAERRGILSLQSEDREPGDHELQLQRAADANTAAIYNSKKTASRQRPASAGVLRHRMVLQDTKPQPEQSLRPSPSEPAFIKRGGFKMPKTASASQESLVNSLTSKYQQDASISTMHNLPASNTSLPSSGITLPRTYNRSSAAGGSASIGGDLTSRPLTGQNSRQTQE